MTRAAPRIVSDVSHVTLIKHANHFAWQAHYLVTRVALRIVSDVSYVTKIKHASHFAWQAQYLVRLEGDTCCFAHCKKRFICEKDTACQPFLVTGAGLEGDIYCCAYCK